MVEIELGASASKIFDMTQASMDGVEFSGPCIATGTVVAGGETAPNGWRMTSILTATIGDETAAICGCVDFKDDVGHHSAGPASLTIAVPSGHHAKFVVTGGRPNQLLIALVKMES